MKRILETVALGGAVIGSTLISLNIGMNVLGYLFFFLSSVASVWLLKMSDASKVLIAVQFWFMITNIIGSVRY